MRSMLLWLVVGIVLVGPKVYAQTLEDITGEEVWWAEEDEPAPNANQ